MIGAIRQDQDYHRFADDRAFFGVENAVDTLSSLAFLAVGVLGLLFLWRERGGPTRFEAPEEMRAYWALFGAVAVTGLGSVYYHLAPDDARLAWDRLPMAIAFMSLLAAVITERVSLGAGGRLVIPFIALGAGSVFYWAIFEDLWPYVVVQFGSGAVILVLSTLFPSRYTRGETIFLVVVVYGVAKLFELYDREIYELDRWASGHTLKHFTAALACYLIVLSLKRRSIRPSSGRLTPRSPGR